eukprot:TRINITY_DN25100_c0_g1_i1.p1 TRINITY_DN25100_c0_g1~~TRINITY_DN25100_c0_g1_i1.p1  ORF type:complete len:113 (-),score=12.02 TRINITY_DN25100_c0_g1_i1:46-384(-)
MLDQPSQRLLMVPQPALLGVLCVPSPVPMPLPAKLAFRSRRLRTQLSHHHSATVALLHQALRSRPQLLHRHAALPAGFPGSRRSCLLYTSDAADEEDSVDLGGCRIIKKKKQ